LFAIELAALRLCLDFSNSKHHAGIAPALRANERQAFLMPPLPPLVLDAAQTVRWQNVYKPNMRSIRPRVSLMRNKERTTLPVLAWAYRQGPIAAVLFALLANVAMAGDWPQILGPQRNGIAENERLTDHLPASGPTVIWQQPVGNGVAGVAVAGGKLVLFHRQGDSEIVECLKAQSGKSLWKQTFATQYVSTILPDDGPRCVPVIAQERVFVFGAGGGLHALSLTDGQKLWSHDCTEEFRAPEGYFGIGSTPIVAGNRLICNVGAARQGAGVVAFDTGSGKVVWQATDEQASYSSPVAATVDGVRHVIFAARLSALSLDPESGKVLFQFPFGARGPTVNAANPVVLDGHLFLTSSYGVGAVWARLGNGRAETVWTNDDTLSSQYTTPVAHGGYLYGIDGRQDVGVARLRCIEPRTGKVMWTEEGFGTATLILADGKLVIVKSDGELVLARPSPQRYEQLATTRISNSTHRALPALSDGLLYVRDETTLRCLDLRKAAP
jgi:outer membrane protein assembly factor BamB